MARPRPEGLDARWVKRGVVRLSQAIAWLYQRSDGKLGKLWLRGAPLCLLTTRGRQSGKPRTTPLVYVQDGPDFVVVACFSGLPHAPQWLANLQARPEAELQVAARHFRVRGRVAEGTERARLWPLVTGVFPDFADYEAWWGRALPVVVLEPA